MYAKQWAMKLGLSADEYLTKDPALKERIDLAFDDANVDLAKVNVKVKRLKNHVVRYPEKVQPATGDAQICTPCGESQPQKAEVSPVEKELYQKIKAFPAYLRSHMTIGKGEAYRIALQYFNL